MSVNIEIGHPTKTEKVIVESETPVEVNGVVVGYIEGNDDNGFKFDDKFYEWFMDWVKEHCPEAEADAYEILKPTDAFGRDNPYGDVEEAITVVEEFFEG